ncbi:MAG: penicillin-binding protein 2 [Lachnospiraceae bacterium]|nr:penicillin-binding protein 2 [Lachnospiraceae bacterium]
MRSNKEEIKTPKVRRKKRRSLNREFAVVTYSMIALYLALIVYFCYFVGFQSEAFINHSSNPRLSVMSEHTIRGDIKTSDNVVLAHSDYDGKNETRVYPKGREYAHVVGFSVNGMSGAEKDANFYLLRSHAFIIDRLKNDLFEKKNEGDNVILTLDSKAQEAAYNGMGSYKGAVVAMDPETGKILAMVSKPDFDPSTISQQWESLTSSSSESILLNRATQGLYPPGSTFKIITALAYDRNGRNDNVTFDCSGDFTSDGFTIHCYGNKAHGNQSFETAFANSCNTTFAKIGLVLKKNSLKNAAEDFLFNTDIPTDISNVKSSSFTMDKSANDALIMQTSIGQGNTLATPLQMALVASTVANNGYLMEPYYIDSIENNNGINVKTFKPVEYGRLISKKEANRLKKYMRKVVTEGTGTGLLTSSYKAYGKTGTAEFSSNKNEAHSWFVGFANKNGKKIAVSVIMEGAGAGSSHALPLAKKIIDSYLSK